MLHASLPQQTTANQLTRRACAFVQSSNIMSLNPSSSLVPESVPDALPDAHDVPNAPNTPDTPDAPYSPDAPESVPDSFETRDEAVSYIKAAQRRGGFACRVIRSFKNGKNGTEVRRIDLGCSRGGKLQPSRSTGRRNRPTKNCECPWVVSIV